MHIHSPYKTFVWLSFVHQDKQRINVKAGHLNSAPCLHNSVLTDLNRLDILYGCGCWRSMIACLNSCTLTWGGETSTGLQCKKRIIQVKSSQVLLIDKLYYSKKTVWLGRHLSLNWTKNNPPSLVYIVSPFKECHAYINMNWIKLLLSHF